MNNSVQLTLYGDFSPVCNVLSSEHILYVIHYRIIYPSKEFVQAITFNLFPS
jgi:hypothetical protein